MKAVIIEDDPKITMRMTDAFVYSKTGIEVQAVLSSLEESKLWFSNNPEPDIIFADIRLIESLPPDTVGRKTTRYPLILINQMPAESVNVSSNVTKTYPSRIFIKRGDLIVPLDVDHISCLKCSDKMIVCHMNDGKEFALMEKMKTLSRKLDPTKFIRISRQWVVNVGAIKHLSCGITGKGHIIMSHNVDIELSREKYSQVIKQLV